MKKILCGSVLLILMVSCTRKPPAAGTPAQVADTVEIKAEDDWLLIGGKRVHKYDALGYYILRDEYYTRSEAESLTRVYLNTFPISSKGEAGMREGLDGIERLINLEKLAIEHIDINTLDFSPLYTLRNLKEIGFSTADNGMTVFPDLKRLSSRDSISVVWIKCTGFTSLKNIEYLSNVRHVQIMGGNDYYFVLTGLESLCQLDKLERLEILDAYNSAFQVRDIASLTTLKTLELKFKEIDLEGIQQLSNLEYLNLHESGIRDISLLSELNEEVWLEMRERDAETDDGWEPHG